MRHRSAGLLSAVLLGTVSTVWSEVLNLGTTGVLQVEPFLGVPKWHLYPHLWSYVNVNVSCPHRQSFEVFTAQDKSELHDKVIDGETAWCGLDRLLSGHKNKCSISLSPFQNTYIGVVPSKGISHFKSGKARCTLLANEQASLPSIIAGLLGLALFFNAGELSHSMSFRVTTGSLTFMLLAVLVLAFLVARMTPNKKSMVAAFAFFGSSISGIVRYFFGRWVPSWHQLIHNKLVWAYVVLSGLSGMALTYYYDNEGNVKLLNILKYGLMLLGIGLVYCSTSMTEASLLLCTVLLSSVPLSLMWDKRKQRLQTTLSESKQAGKQLLQQLHEEPILDPSPQKGSTLGRQEPQPAFSQTPGPAGRRVTSKAGWRHPAQDQPLPGDHEASTPPPARFGSPLPGHQHAGTSEDNVSPLIQRGKILNEVTGRVIKLHSATYNKLVANGYVVDKQNGILTPPKAVDDSDDTDQDQPSYTPSQSARSRSRMSAGQLSAQ